MIYIFCSVQSDSGCFCAPKPREAACVCVLLFALPAPGRGLRRGECVPSRTHVYIKGVMVRTPARYLYESWLPGQPESPFQCARPLIRLSAHTHTPLLHVSFLSNSCPPNLINGASLSQKRIASRAEKINFIRSPWRRSPRQQAPRIYNKTEIHRKAVAGAERVEETRRRKINRTPAYN